MSTNEIGKEEEGLAISLLKLTPIVVLAAMIMVFELDVIMAATIAFLYAIFVAMLTMKMSFKDLLNHAINSVSEINIVFFILMLAYGVAESFMSSGVGASVISLALKMGVTGRTVAVVSFLTTCLLSVATGTSWGTFAACAPIFLWLCDIVGGDPVFTVASIAGGACFGDNIGLISDTTVVSSGLQGVEVIHRVRHQGVWSALCVIVSAIIIYFISAYVLKLPTVTGDAATAIDSIAPETIEVLMEERPGAVALLNQVQKGVPMWSIIPFLLILGLAFAGFDTFICLGSGIIACMLVGLLNGEIASVKEFVSIIQVGFEDAGSGSIVMMFWVVAFGSMMGIMSAFDIIAKGIVKLANNVKQLMFYNAILCLLGNMALSDEMAQIVTISPIIKEVTDANVVASEEDMYTLRLRNASFADAMGVYGAVLIPWHVYVAFYVGIAQAIYPIGAHLFTPQAFVLNNVMAFVTVGSMLLLTITGLDRFIPLFKLPSEPDVYLKKHAHRYENKSKNKTERI